MLRWFNDLKLQTKFVAPVALLVILGLAALGAVLVRVHVVNEAVKEVVREQEKLTNLQQSLILLQQQELVEKNYLLSGDAVHTAAHEELDEQVDRYLNWAKDYTADEDDMEAIEAVEAQMDAYYDNYNQLIDLKGQEQHEEAAQLTFTVSDSAVSSVYNSINDIIDDGKALVAAKTAEAEEERQEAVVLTVVSVVLFGLVGLGVVMISRQTAAPVLRMTSAAAVVEAGEYDLPMLEPMVARQDELGQLARVFKHMVAEVHRREEALKQQVMTLKIEIDTARKEKDVAEITESDYFQDLQEQARELRRKNQADED